MKPSRVPRIPEDKIPPNVPQTQLVEILGYSVVSINKWRRHFDDFPQPNEKTKLYNVKKVQDWLLAHPEVGEAGQKITGNREVLMCENLAKRNTLLDKQIARAELESVDIDKVLAGFAAERAIAMASFRKRMLSELPTELEGKTAREVSDGLEAAFNEFLQDVQDSIPDIIKACDV